MWPGPYGEFGSRKYLLASLDQSLARMGLDYVDIFYSHRPDPETPLEETMGALDTAVRQGKALYAGISSYSAEQTARGAPRSCASWARRCSSTSRPTRCSTAGSRTACSTRWASVGRRLHRLLAARAGHAHRQVPATASRRARGRPGRVAVAGACSPTQTLAKIRALNEIAQRRGQSLAQMALAWALRDPRVTSVADRRAAASPSSRRTSPRSTTSTSRDDELAEIDRYATESDINLW